MKLFTKAQKEKLIRNHTENEKEIIESRGYKKAVKSFQNKNPKLKEVVVEWVKNGIELSKLQKLPLGRKKKLG